MTWRDHIAVDPHIWHGKACVRGTRVLVTVILDNLAAGESAAAVAEAYHAHARRVDPSAPWTASSGLWTSGGFACVGRKRHL